MKNPPAWFWILLMTLLLILTGIFFLLPVRDSTHTHRSQAQLFRMNLGTEPPTLDPAEADDLISITVLSNIMRGLVQYGNESDIVPAYAEHWTISPDGRRYVFHLRKNGKWQDGKPVTAHDFVYAWQRVLEPKTGSPYAFLLFDIKNAKTFADGKLKDATQLGFKAHDAYTLEVQLDRPVTFFMQLMAFSITLPQRRDIIEKHGQSFTEAGNLMANGPYILSQWAHENRIVLKPNSRYWAGPPKNNGIEMDMIPEPNTSLMMYENNELDFVETPSTLPAKEVRRLKTRPDFHQKTIHAITYMGFNTQKKPFNDPKVRRALIAAFDRTYIPKLFQGGEQPMMSWISPGLFAYDPKIGINLDISKAQKLLKEAGYPNGTGFPHVELWYANTTPENRQMAEIAQFQWKKHLGIHVNLKNVEWKVYLKQLSDDPPQIFRLQWYADYPDPDSFLGVFLTESGNNYTQWRSSVYDNLVHQAATEPNPRTRKTLYDKAQKMLLEDTAAIMPLYVVPKSYLLKPNIKGFRLNELNTVILDEVQKQ